MKRGDTVAGFWSVVRLERGKSGRCRWRYRWTWPVMVALLLTACSGIQTGPGTSYIVLHPPKELATPVPEPVLAEKPDNGQLASWAAELQAALREANRRLRKLSEL